MKVYSVSVCFFFVFFNFFTQFFLSFPLIHLLFARASTGFEQTNDASDTNTEYVRNPIVWQYQAVRWQGKMKKEEDVYREKKKKWVKK